MTSLPTLLSSGGRRTLAVLLTCLAAAGSALAAEAPESPRVDNGGIGQGEVRLMQERAAPYNLRMTFSEGRDSAYVTGVQLSIQGAGQAEALSLGDAGPITNVQLPPGRYTVAATYQGETRRSTVDVPARGARTLNLWWPQD